MAAVELVKEPASRLLKDLLHGSHGPADKKAAGLAPIGEVTDISARKQIKRVQDLHDGLRQYLSALALHARVLADDLQQEKSCQAPEAERIVTLIRTTSEIARELDRALQMP